VASLGHGDTQTAGAVINQMIPQQAYQISFNEVFYMLGGVFFALIFIVWLAKPPFSAKPGAAASAH
jgi:MFS transporter, DHA2 family, multidrug resistance protein